MEVNSSSSVTKSALRISESSFAEKVKTFIELANTSLFVDANNNLDGPKLGDFQL